MLVNGCGQSPQFVHSREIFIIKMILIIQIIQELPSPKKTRNINNIINIDSIDNIRNFTSCGSGKKYKNCCGKNT